MKIFIALCCDRHIDPEVYVFTSRDDAIDRAKLFVDENAAYPEDVEEEKIDGWEYYCRYSAEDDYVQVTQGVLYQGKPATNRPTNEEIVKVLEMLRNEHYDGGYEGLNSCNAIVGKGVCDCGADEINSEIHGLVKKLECPNDDLP